APPRGWRSSARRTGPAPFGPQLLVARASGHTRRWDGSRWRVAAAQAPTPAPRRLGSVSLARPAQRDKPRSAAQSAPSNGQRRRAGVQVRRATSPCRALLASLLMLAALRAWSRRRVVIRGTQIVGAEWPNLDEIEVAGGLACKWMEVDLVAE